MVGGKSEICRKSRSVNTRQTRGYSVEVDSCRIEKRSKRSAMRSNNL